MLMWVVGAVGSGGGGSWVVSAGGGPMGGIRAVSGRGSSVGSERGRGTDGKPSIGLVTIAGVSTGAGSGGVVSGGDPASIKGGGSGGGAVGMAGLVVLHSVGDNARNRTGRGTGGKIVGGGVSIGAGISAAVCVGLRGHS